MTARRAWLGPSVVAGIVIADLIGAGTLIVCSQRDPAFGVEPDYYAKALAWDSTRAALERSARLGWSATITDDGPAEGGARRVVLRLASGDGAPIRGASIGCIAFHNARSTDRVSPAFAERPTGAPGEYEAMLSAPRPGAWEFRIAASAGEGRFVRTMAVAIGGPAAAGASGEAP